MPREYDSDGKIYCQGQRTILVSIVGMGKTKEATLYFKKNRSPQDLR